MGYREKGLGKWLETTLLGFWHLDKGVETGHWGTVAELDELGEQLVAFGQRDLLLLNVEQEDADSSGRGDAVDLCLVTRIEVVADKQAILMMGHSDAGAFAVAQALT